MKKTKFRTEATIKNSCLEYKSKEGVIMCFANNDQIVNPAAVGQAAPTNKVCDNCIREVCTIQINSTLLPLTPSLNALLEAKPSPFILLDKNGNMYDKLFSQISLSQVEGVKATLNETNLPDFENLIKNLPCIKSVEIFTDQDNPLDRNGCNLLAGLLMQLNNILNIKLPIFDNTFISEEQKLKLVETHLKEVPVKKIHLDLEFSIQIKEEIFLHLIRALGNNSNLTDLLIKLPYNKSIANNGLNEVAQLIKNQSKLTFLHLDFMSNLSFEDQQLIDLANALQGKNEIKTIILNFHKNDNFTDVGLIKLSDSFANYSKAEKVFLDFHNNTQFTDNGVYSLASGLNRMKGISSLHVDLCENRILNDKSLSALARMLINKQNIHTLHINLGNSTNLTSQSFLDFGQGLEYITDLKSLYLNFEKSTQPNAQSLCQISNSISKYVNLKSLNINYRGNQNADDQVNNAMVKCFKELKSIKSFSLYLVHGYFNSTQDFLERYEEVPQDNVLSATGQSS